MQFIIQNITEDKVQKAMQAIRDNGGTAGDGSFSVKGITGRYSRGNDRLFIDIQSKPLLVPWKMIEVRLNEFFG